MRETHLETYLSSYVHNLLVNFGQKLERNESKIILLFDLTIDWTAISDALGSLLIEASVLEQPSSWYKSALQCMWPIYHSIHLEFYRAEPSHREKVLSRLEWTGHSDSIIHLYREFVEARTNESKLLLFLHLTSALERGLGNVYASIKLPVPFLLRDLLNTQELSNILGKVTTVFIQLMVGTPCGLNLRNLMWHGFVHPREVSEALVTVLLVVIATLGSMLTNQETPISAREYFSPSEFDSLLQEDSADMFCASHLRCLVSSTEIVPPAFKSLWSCGLDLSDKSRYGECCMVLLPQIEHVLRCAFCAFNNRSPRLLSAEAGTLYTTLDSILLPHLVDGDARGREGEKNELHSVMTVDVITMIDDLLTFPHGPRLRDKLSHGEIRLASISSHLCRRFIHVLVHIFLKLSKLSHHYRRSQDTSFKDLAFLNVDSVTYCPKFHLVPVAKRSILKSVQAIRSWDPVRPPPGLDALGHLDSSSIGSKFFIVAVQERISATKSELESFSLFDKFSTFKVMSHDCSVFKNHEMMRCLIQIAEQLLEVHKNVEKSLEEKHALWIEFKLRERGRKTYAKILQSVPVLEQCLVAILFLVICNFIAAALGHSAPSLLRDVKSVLSAVQNVRHYTDSAVNRWSEILSIIKTIVIPVLKRCEIEAVPFDVAFT